MGKLGILGGTFNPIHNGHLYLAKNAYLQLGLDKVLIVPSGISYMKLNDNVLAKDIRATMTKLAIEDYPYFEFSDIELEREGNTYTYETLEQLKNIYPDDDFYFLIGADTLFSIEKWKEINRVFSNCILSVMVRDEKNLDNISNKCLELFNNYHAQTVIINTEKIDISSSAIRNLIKNKCYNDVVNMLPQKVYDYIITNKIYQ